MMVRTRIASDDFEAGDFSGKWDAVPDSPNQYSKVQTCLGLEGELLLLPEEKPYILTGLNAGDVFVIEVVNDAITIWVNEIERPDLVEQVEAQRRQRGA